MNLYGLSTEAIGQPLFSSQATPKHSPGTIARDGSGRVFRYVLNGGVALVVGNCIQAAAQDTAHQNLTPTVTTYGAIGDTTIVATLGASAAAADLYAGGYAIVDTTPGLGCAYRISGHAAVLSAGVITLALDPSGPIQVALTASSRITLVRNPYRGVIQTPVTTLTGAVVGVAIYPIAIAEYGWIQTGGVASVLVAGTPGVGFAVSCPTTSAGACAINSSTLPIIGNIMVTGQAGLCQPVFLTLDS